MSAAATVRAIYFKTTKGSKTNYPLELDYLRVYEDNFESFSSNIDFRVIFIFQYDLPPRKFKIKASVEKSWTMSLMNHEKGILPTTVYQGVNIRIHHLDRLREASIEYRPLLVNSAYSLAMVFQQ